MFETSDASDAKTPADAQLDREAPAARPARPRERREPPGDGVSPPLVRQNPSDIRHRPFPIRFRGYDQTEVRTYLTELADDLEQVLHEIRMLQNDLSRMDEALAEHRTREQTLRDTLLTAQKLSDDLREKAEVEAREIVKTAQDRGDLLVEKAHTRAQDIEREIGQLREKRRAVEQEIEEVMGTLQATLDEIRERDRRDGEDRIRLMPPRRHDDESDGNAEATEAGLDEDLPLRRQGEP